MAADLAAVVAVSTSMTCSTLLAVVSVEGEVEGEAQANPLPRRHGVRMWNRPCPAPLKKSSVMKRRWWNCGDHHHAAIAGVEEAPENTAARPAREPVEPRWARFTFRVSLAPVRGTAFRWSVPDVRERVEP